MTCHCWCWPWSPNISLSDSATVKIAFPSLPIPYSLEESHHVQSNLRGWGMCSTNLSLEYLHKLFGNPICGRFVYFPSFVYLCSHLLCLYELMDIYVMLWIVIQYYVIYFSCPDHSSCSHKSLGTLSFGSCVPLTHPLPYLLSLEDAPDSSYVFSIPVLGSAIFPRNLGFFYWRKAFRSQDLGVACAHNYWGIIASRSSQS